MHPELLKLQKLPPEFVGKRVWDERLAEGSHFEDYLNRQGRGLGAQKVVRQAQGKWD